MVTPAYSFIGQGLYSPADAERLTRIPRRRIRRWIEGYTFVARGKRRASPAIVHPRVGRAEGELTLTFSDLVEVRFLDAFLSYGVSWRAIRVAAERARELLSLSHPFSSRRFKTDGRDILAEIARPGRDPELLNLVHNQWEISHMVMPMLHAGLEFDTDLDEPVRWWPKGRRLGIVLDPLRSFGAPIVARRAVRTSILSSAAAANGDALAAAMFDVTVSEVRRAVVFERELTA